MAALTAQPDSVLWQMFVSDTSGKEHQAIAHVVFEFTEIETGQKFVYVVQNDDASLDKIFRYGVIKMYYEKLGRNDMLDHLNNSSILLSINI